MDLFFYRDKVKVKTTTLYLGDPQEFCFNVLSIVPLMLIERLGLIDFKNLKHQQKLGSFVSKLLKFDEVEMFDMTDEEIYVKYLK